MSRPAWARVAGLPTRHDRPAVTPRRILLAAVVAQSAISFAEQGVPTIVVFVKHDLALSATAAGVIVAALGLGRIIGFYAAGRAVDTRGERRVLFAGAVGSGACVAIAAAFHYSGMARRAHRRAGSSSRPRRLPAGSSSSAPSRTTDVGSRWDPPGRRPDRRARGGGNAPIRRARVRVAHRLRPRWARLDRRRLRGRRARGARPAGHRRRAPPLPARVDPAVPAPRVPPHHSVGLRSRRLSVRSAHLLRRRCA